MLLGFDRNRALRHILVSIVAATSWQSCASRTPAPHVPPFEFSAPVAVRAAAPPFVPLYVDVWPTAYGTTQGPLLSEMQLRSGARIGLEVRTSRAAQGYLMHCDGRGVLSVFPPTGPLRFAADARIPLPAFGTQLPLGEHPGDEALYILVSQQPLEQSDRQLKAALAHAGKHGGSCGAELEALLIGATERTKQQRARSAVLPQVESQRLRQLSVLRGLQGSRTYPAVVHAYSEQDGVVILRFRYRHLQ